MTDRMINVLVVADSKVAQLLLAHILEADPQMRVIGAVSIAQDHDSSVVHGMPGEAIKLGGATHVWPADRIADGLLAAVTRAKAPEVEL